MPDRQDRWSELEQCDKLFDLLIGGGPAGADTHYGVRTVGLLHEAQTNMPLQTFRCLIVKRDENLIGRRVEGQYIARSRGVRRQ